MLSGMIDSSAFTAKDTLYTREHTLYGDGDDEDSALFPGKMQKLEEGLKHIAEISDFAGECLVPYMRQMFVKLLKHEPEDLQNAVKALADTITAGTKEDMDHLGIARESEEFLLSSVISSRVSRKPSTEASSTLHTDHTESEDSPFARMDSLKPSWDPRGRASLLFARSKKASHSGLVTGAPNKRTRRGSMSAAVIDPGLEFTPPFYEKSQETRDFINQHIKGSFMFANMDDEVLQTVILAFRRFEFKEGDEILSYGDEVVTPRARGPNKPATTGPHAPAKDTGDYLYLVESGHCTGNNPEMEAEAEEYSAGMWFGEIALMYQSPRRMTVKAMDDVLTWGLDRETYRRLAITNSHQKNQRYAKFFSQVNIFKSLSFLQHARLSRFVDELIMPPDETIISEGEVGNEFYILESGEACAMKKYTDEEGNVREHVVKHYKSGDYFGEMALLYNQPRQASIISTTAVKLITMDRETFQRVMGPVWDEIVDLTKKYKVVNKQIQHSLSPRASKRCSLPSDGSSLRPAEFRSSSLPSNKQLLDLSPKSLSATAPRLLSKSFSLDSPTKTTHTQTNPASPTSASQSTQTKPFKQKQTETSL